VFLIKVSVNIPAAPHALFLFGMPVACQGKCSLCMLSLDRDGHTKIKTLDMA
jgi:hypothetical protein